MGARRDAVRDREEREQWDEENSWQLLPAATWTRVGSGCFGCDGDHWQKQCQSVALAVKSLAWAAITHHHICLGCCGQHALRFCEEVTTHTKNAIWAEARAQFQRRRETFQQLGDRLLQSGYATVGDQLPRGMPRDWIFKCDKDPWACDRYPPLSGEEGHKEYEEAAKEYYERLILAPVRA